MQITQSTSLDTLQLLSSREALQAFKVGQIIKVSVIQGTPPEQGGGRALLEIAGRQHEVRSLVPLSSGQKLLAKLQQVGDRVLLQPVKGETVTGKNLGPADSGQMQTATESVRLIAPALRNLLPRAQPVQQLVELARALRQHPQFHQLPEDLRNTLIQLVEAQPGTPRPDARTLRQAIENSGLFLENRLATNTETAPQSLQQDLKGLLFRLLQLLDHQGIRPSPTAPDLKDSLFNSPQKALVHTAALANTPLAYPIRVKKAALDQPLETLLKQLFQLADGALAKTTVQQLQHLSRASAGLQSGGLQLDIPWISPWGTLPIHLEVEPEHEPPQTSAENTATSWQIRLALTLPHLGAIQAALLLQGQQLSTQCWCEHATSQALLKRYENRFQQRINQLGLQMEALVFRGTPILDDPPPLPSRSQLLDVQA